MLSLQNHLPPLMPHPEFLVVNLTTSGSAVGGAGAAAEWHSRFMASTFPIQLWRMWDSNSCDQLDALTIRNFISHSKYRFFESRLPKQLRALTLESPLLAEILNQKPKLIHLQNPVPGLFFQKLAQQAKQAGIKVVISTHGFYEVLNPNYNLNLAQKLAWQAWVTNPVVKALAPLCFGGQSRDYPFSP
jgi:alpha-maltose-1-phosphate synthase